MKVNNGTKQFISSLEENPPPPPSLPRDNTLLKNIASKRESSHCGKLATTKNMYRHNHKRMDGRMDGRKERRADRRKEGRKANTYT
jgi:hypothetical protein